ncbi:23S rRNA (adenine(2503)-C(2))-methyltransferase RlmN [Candidatus Dojkabacteria bacterium]|nr:23S rRNA (adenine(2503)-C(2))-methyltransferase RlmN [Candidatus Dojkabacteria bacterium]
MFRKFINKYNLPGFRLKQIEEAFYQKPIRSFEEITTLPKDIKNKLSQEITFSTLREIKKLESKNSKTIKLLFERSDKKKIETVLIRHKDKRNTVCVSCMVGCPVGCIFCATGKMGFGGNLSAQEIIDQILYFNRFLLSCKKPQKVTNVVFMGMGEPLLNLSEVQKSLDIITDPAKLGLSKRRIIISTCGYIPQFKKLVKDGFKGRFAISLHAPNQKLREKIMPIARLFPIDKLIKATTWYMDLRNKRISYEYIMIHDVNDRGEHAQELVALLKGQRLAHINLIPYNPITIYHDIKTVNKQTNCSRFLPDKYSFRSFRRSSRNRIHSFAKILTEAGIPATIRVTMGEDVEAACGQLTNIENNTE